MTNKDLYLEMLKKQNLTPEGQERIMALLGSTPNANMPAAKPYMGLGGEVTLPVKKPENVPSNAVGNLSNQKPANPPAPSTPTTPKEEKPKPITPPSATPTIPDAAAPEGDKKDEETTDAPSNEINLNDILAKLQKGYAQSDEVKQALANWNKHMESRPNDWNGGSYLNPLNAVIGQINNRDPFKYDVNADALYHMYRDLYMQGGKMAMQDTMGQSAMMTGGYGNSYSATAGNQAYQGYLQQLNGVVPELYQLALNKYNAEGDALYDKANLYKSMYDQEYGEHLDKVDDWYNEGNRLGNLYQTLAEEDYNNYVNEFNTNLKTYQTMVGDFDGDGKKDPTPEELAQEAARNLPATIISKLEAINDEEELNDYLYKLALDGTIPELAQGILYNQYLKKGLTDRTWEATYDGKLNWGGIDEDARVKDQYGNEYTLKELHSMILKELRKANESASDGKKKTENEMEEIAKNYVLKLQKDLDISRIGVKE
jgi:hypothetical protein